jgi:hypothetical protein
LLFQDSQKRNDLNLNINSGILFDNLLLPQIIFKENPKRISLESDVNPGSPTYAIIVSNNAGLWGYSLCESAVEIYFGKSLPELLSRVSQSSTRSPACGEHVMCRRSSECVA